MTNPATRGARQGLNWKCFPATSTSDNATVPSTVSIEITVDPVVIFAARSRVAPATVRAQLAAWRIGGANG